MVLVAFVPIVRPVGSAVPQCFAQRLPAAYTQRHGQTVECAVRAHGHDAVYDEAHEPALPAAVLGLADDAVEEPAALLHDRRFAGHDRQVQRVGPCRATEQVFGERRQHDVGVAKIIGQGERRAAVFADERLEPALHHAHITQKTVGVEQDGWVCSECTGHGVPFRCWPGHAGGGVP